MFDQQLIGSEIFSLHFPFDDHSLAFTEHIRFDSLIDYGNKLLPVFGDVEGKPDLVCVPDHTP